MSGARAWTTRADARAREVLTVQLLPRMLHEGLLPRADVGASIAAVPVIYASAVEPRGCRPAQAWDLDRFGTLIACGSVGPPAIHRDEDRAYGVDVLRVGARAFPLNCAEIDLPDDEELPGTVYVEGSLYLDTDLTALDERSAIVTAFRRSYRVAAVRRYRPVPGRRPREEALAAFPAPGDVPADAFLHVADLLALPGDQRP